MTAFAAVKCDSNLIPSNYMLQHGYHLSELFLIGLKMLLFSHSLTHLPCNVCMWRGTFLPKQKLNQCKWSYKFFLFISSFLFHFPPSRDDNLPIASMKYERMRGVVYFPLSDQKKMFSTYRRGFYIIMRHRYSLLFIKND